MAWSYELRKGVGRDGGEDQAAIVIQWPQVAFVQEAITSDQKASGAGRIEVSANTLIIGVGGFLGAGEKGVAARTALELKIQLAPGSGRCGL
jgi:hypothetical protein